MWYWVLRRPVLRRQYRGASREQVCPACPREYSRHNGRARNSPMPNRQRCLSLGTSLRAAIRICTLRSYELSTEWPLVAQYAKMSGGRDRKRVVSVKNVAGSVNAGGCRIITKKP